MAKLENDTASRLARDNSEQPAALEAWRTPSSVKRNGGREVEEGEVGSDHERRRGVCGEEGQCVRCRSEFFNQQCTELARSMLGCVLVSVGESGEVCRGRVVETEAYLGGEDKASHSYNGRRSRANEAMFMVRSEKSGGKHIHMHTYTHAHRLQELLMCTPYMACTTASMCLAMVLGQLYLYVPSSQSLDRRR